MRRVPRSSACARDYWPPSFELVLLVPLVPDELDDPLVDPDEPVPELLVSLLGELPIPDDEPLVLEPPCVSDVLPEPLCFSGVVVVLEVSLLVVPASALELRRGERPLRPSGRAFFPSPTTPVPGSEPVSELVVPGSLAAPVRPPVEPSCPVELLAPGDVPEFGAGVALPAPVPCPSAAPAAASDPAARKVPMSLGRFMSILRLR
jgi:hypothetical protein